MTNTIFLSHTSETEGVSDTLSEILVKRGYTMLDPAKEIHAGMNIREEYQRILAYVDIYIILFDETASAGFKSQALSLLEVVNEKRKLIIPLAYETDNLPQQYNALSWIFVTHDMDLGHIADEIESSIQAWNIKDNTIKKAEKIRTEELEENVAAYVDEAISELKVKELKFTKKAGRWLFIGASAYILSLAFAAVYTIIFSLNIQQVINWPQVVLYSFRGFLIISVALIFGKYALGIAENYQRESIRNSDRIHAIAFEKFYLKAFGDKANWQEIKEVFQHWNIDSDVIEEKEEDSVDSNAVEKLIGLLTKHTSKPDAK